MAIDSFLAQGGMPNPFGNATGAVGETGDMLAAGAADAKKYLNWTIEHKDGKQKAVYDMDMETSKEFQSQLKQLDAIKTSYNDEVNRISQKEAQTRAHPIASILANVASAFAQNPKNPGWVQSLGKFASAENPTADALMREKMQVQGGIAGLLKEQAGITGEMAQVGARTAAMRMGAQKETRLAINEVATHLTAIATKGNPIDPQLAKSMFLQAGATEEQADAASKLISDAATSAHDQKQAEELAKETKSNKDRAARDKENMDRIKGMLDATFLRTKAMQEKAGKANQPLGEKATQWENGAGERPDAMMTMKQAADAGFKPVGKVSTADTRRASMTLMDQLFDLIPKLDKKGYFAGGPGLAKTMWAKGQRALEPGDPDLVAWNAHAGTMVSLLRQLGDIGPRAISAYQSAIAVIDHPTTAAAAKQALENLRDAINSAKPAEKGKASEGTTYDPKTGEWH